jgi:hypothetical protein
MRGTQVGLCLRHKLVLIRPWFIGWIGGKLAYVWFKIYKIVILFWYVKYMISLIINGFTLGITKLIFATCVTTSFPLKINQIFIWTYNSLTVNCCSGKFCGFCLCKNKCPVVADILGYQTTRMPTFHRFIQWTRAGLKPIYAVKTGQL